MKKKSYPIWGGIYPPIVFYLLNVVVQIVVVLVLKICHVNINNYLSPVALASLLIADGIALPFLIWLRYSDTKKDFNNCVEFENTFIPKYILIIPFAMFVTLSANTIVSILQRFMPAFMAHSYDDTAKGIFGSGPILTIVTVVIVGPIVEELLFRGLMYSRFKRVMGPAIGGLISSILFGIYHLNWLQAPYAFIIGMCLVFVYERYKSLGACFLFHCTANCIVTVPILLMKNSDIASTFGQQTQSPGLTVLLPLCLLYSFAAAIFGLVIFIVVQPKRIKAGVK